MATDLERAFSALTSKAASYNSLFGYYDGNQPLLYSSKRLKEIFRGLDAIFVENWCAVVVDAVKDRVNLASIAAADKGVQAAIDELWESSEIKLESDDVHEATMITGEAFFITWPDDEGLVQGFSNDPRMCHAFYSSENPRQMSYAAKWFTDDDGLARMTLYYPDRLEYYQTRKQFDNVSSSAAFVPADPPSAVNPYGEIPVFHFRTRRRSTIGYLQDVVPIQNGINKLLTDMMVAAEYGAFNQRWVISNADTKGKLKNAPNEIWNIPAGDGMGQASSVGQFQSTDLQNYLQAIDNLAMTLSSITRTPKNYFIRQGGDPSGEALIAMESPLNKKAIDFIDRCIPVWKRAAAFMLKLGGITVSPRDITPVFDSPETIQPRTSAEIVQIETSSGVPLRTSLKRQGWSEAELDEMEKDAQAEQSAGQASLAKALLDAERQFNAGGQHSNMPNAVSQNMMNGNGNNASAE